MFPVVYDRHRSAPCNEDTRWRCMRPNHIFWRDIADQYPGVADLPVQVVVRRTAPGPRAAVGTWYEKSRSSRDKGRKETMLQLLFKASAGTRAASATSRKPLNSAGRIRQLGNYPRKITCPWEARAYQPAGQRPSIHSIHLHLRASLK